MHDLRPSGTVGEVIATLHYQTALCESEKDVPEDRLWDDLTLAFLVCGIYGIEIVIWTYLPVSGLHKSVTITKYSQKSM